MENTITPLVRHEIVLIFDMLLTNNLATNCYSILFLKFLTFSDPKGTNISFEHETLILRFLTYFILFGYTAKPSVQIYCKKIYLCKCSERIWSYAKKSEQICLHDNIIECKCAKRIVLLDFVPEQLGSLTTLCTFCLRRYHERSKDYQSCCFCGVFFNPADPRGIT